MTTVITDEMVTRAYNVLLEEIYPPYSADARDFTDEDVKAGKLKKADDEAEEMNRALVRRSLEATMSQGEENRDAQPNQARTGEAREGLER
jgi:hypothetical protein